MKAKSIQFFALSLLTLLFCTYGQPSKALGQVLVETVVVTDDWVESNKEFQCGKAIDTPAACQEELRACQSGIDKIMENAYRVCSQRPKDCNFIDVTATGFTRTAYDLLVGEPIHLYTNGFEVAHIKNCRANPPKVEDAPVEPASVDPVDDSDLKDRKEAERARAEAEVGPVEANPAPVEAKADSGSVEVEPVVAANDNIVATTDSAEKSSGSGGFACAAQIAPSVTAENHALVTALLMLIPLAITLRRKTKF